MNKNQKGFGAIEGLLILIIVGLIGFVGWYVWSNRDNSTNSTSGASSTTKQQSAATNTANLAKYDDAYVSFSYPSDWSVNKPLLFSDDYNAYLLTVKAPVDSSLKAADPSTTNVYLETSILVAKNNRFGPGSMTCREDCTVYSSDKVSPKSPSSKGSLVVSDWDSQGYPDVFEYTRDNVAIGDKTYALGIALNDKYYARIYGGYRTEQFTDVQLAANTDFQNSKAYTQLKALIPTVTFKTSALP